MSNSSGQGTGSPGPPDRAASTFDPVAYKEAILAQWEEGAAGWHNWQTALEEWLRPATDLMLEGAHVGPGSRVLDIAAGTGGQTIAAARRVGPTGSVLAIDVSPESLRYARVEAQRAGLKNIETRMMDGEYLRLDPQSFDAVICRIGLTYFTDLVGGLRRIFAVLKRGSRLGAVVYSAADKNPTLAIPINTIRLACELPLPPQGQPGAFSLGDPNQAGAALGVAGYRDINVVKVSARLQLPSLEEYTEFQRAALRGLTHMMANQTTSRQEEVWDLVRAELSQFDGPGGFSAGSELLVLAGERP